MESLIIALALSCVPAQNELPNACDAVSVEVQVDRYCRRHPARRCIVAVAKGVNHCRPFHRRFHRR